MEFNDHSQQFVSIRCEIADGHPIILFAPCSTANPPTHCADCAWAVDASYRKVSGFAMRVTFDVWKGNRRIVPGKPHNAKWQKRKEKKK